MTHDPMCCMTEGKCDGGCECGPIATVRDSAQLSPLDSVLAAISAGTAGAHRPPTHRQRLTGDAPTIDDATTHDSLCHMSEGKWDGGCQCDVIAKVRADERAKILPNPADIRGEQHVDYCRDLYCGGCYEIGADQ